MAKSFLLFLCSILFIGITSAQTARVSITINASGGFKGYVGLSDPEAGDNIALVLDANHTAVRVLTLTHPHNVQVSFKTPADYVTYVLFVSPGDDLQFRADLGKKDNGIVVTGKGSNNNQPEIAPLTDIYSRPDVTGNLPYAAIAVINKLQQLNKTILSNYIAKYKPSSAFITACKYNLAYYAPVKYYYFQTSNLDPVRQTGAWKHLRDSLFATIKLNNDDALGSYNYTSFVPYYLLRLKEKGYDEEENNPEKFYSTWYRTKAAKGKPLFLNERKNLFVEKVLNKNFGGKTAEYLYASLLRQNLAQSMTENIDVIWAHLKQKYPNSKYIAMFSEPVNRAAQRQHRQLNNKMVFAAHNGSNLNSFSDLLALSKGKTVLIDMWGTWCSPCREEIEKNSVPLREHFKGKNLTFMYVDNFDEHNDAAWKKLIAYFNLEGVHILANKKLTTDIMARVKSTGYPTYIIIKKDGTYALAKNQYPVNLSAMIKELEAAL